MKTAATRRRRSVWRDYCLFVALFVLVCVLVFSSFVYNDKSFVWYHDKDGLDQHFVAYVYTGRWLRSVARALVHRQPVPLWDFTIGQGADIVTTFSYYTLGDPLVYLTAVVPSARTEQLYNALILLRLFLAGCAFVAFEHTRGHRGGKVVVAALGYVFTAYAMGPALRHPFFINPMVFLPLLFIGVDRIYERRRPAFFMLAMALSALNNYYLFYILSVAVFAYALYRFFDFEHDRPVREFLATGLRFLCYGFSSVLCAGILLVPTLLVALNSSRTSMTSLLGSLYPLKYYTQLVSAVLSPTTFEYYIGLSGPLLLGSLSLLACPRGKGRLVIGFVGCSLLFLIPAAGSILNAFIYPSNRWAFCYAFLVAHLFVLAWDDLTSPSRLKASLTLPVAVFGAVLLATFGYGASKGAFASYALILLVLLVLVVPVQEGQKRRLSKGVVLSIAVIVGIGINAYALYSINSTGYVKEFLESGKAYRAVTETDYGYVRDTVDERQTEPVLRVERQGMWSEKTDELPSYPLYNTNIIDGVSSTQFYWSVNERHTTARVDDLEVPSYLSWMVTGYDQRTFPLALAGVQYDVTKGDVVPFGFSPTEQGAQFLKNDHVLPYGYTYDSYLLDTDYASLSATQRPQAMMQAAVIEDGQAESLGLPSTQASALSYGDVALPYRIEHRDKVSALRGDADGERSSGSDEFDAVDGGVIRLSFDGMEHCETYLYISGIEAQTVSTIDLYEDDDRSFYSQEEYGLLPTIDRNALVWEDLNTGKFSTSRFAFNVSTGVSSNSFAYVSPLYRWYNARESFLINLGYHDEALDHIDITCRQIGRYRFGDIQVICQPMDQYVTWTDELRADHLEDVSFGTNAISGHITLDGTKLLVIPVSYSAGWSAEIDGKPVDALAANINYLGIEVGEGTYDVTLRYHTPGLKAGILVSLVGGVLLVVCSCVGRPNGRTNVPTSRRPAIRHRRTAEE